MSIMPVDVVSELALSQYCTPVNNFLHNVSIYFGSCIPTPLALVSTLLGYLSIMSWLCAQMPQIYKNYQLQSASGLSPYFLIEWLMGDLTNLLGALFTKQATWQVIVASYYCFVDVCLVYQYFWYTHIVPWWREGSVHSGGSNSSDDDDDDDDDASSDLINSLSPINSSFADLTMATAKNDDQEPSDMSHTRSAKTTHSSNTTAEKRTPQVMKDLSLASTEKVATQLPYEPSGQLQSGLQWPNLSTRTLIYTATAANLVTQAMAAPTNSRNAYSLANEPTTLEFIGRIISWCSTGFYLISRIPQLYKNWKRQSTTGLSPYLFIAAFCGNLFYSSSMFTNPKLWYDLGPHGGHGWVDRDGSSRLDYLIDGLPFFLGAFIVLFLDGTMFVQFKLYGEQQDKIIKVRDAEGFGRWQRVNGWMRGWIPSVQKERVVDLSESQRLLSESREMERHRRISEYGTI